MYSSQVLDHFQNPRNPGELHPADATVRLENPACGDVLELSARVEGGRIAEIRFRAKGCVSAMACGSAVTEMVQGKPLEDAVNLSREDLVQKVGGLPDGSTHASYLAIEALASLLKKLRPIKN